MGAKRRCIVNNTEIRFGNQVGCRAASKKTDRCKACSAKRGRESGHGPSKASGEGWGRVRACSMRQPEPNPRYMLRQFC